LLLEHRCLDVENAVRNADAKSRMKEDNFLVATGQWVILAQYAIARLENTALPFLHENRSMCVAC
jgi:hypothetical protein